jgi:ribosomal protein S20
MKNRAGIFVVFLIVVLFSLLFSTSVMAESKVANPVHIDRFSSRVAVILGLDEPVVSDAVKQARQEVMEEQFQARLSAMVDKGLLTQEEASEKLAKVQSKVGDDSLRMNKNQFPKKKFRYEDLESRLSAMVDKGLLTQEEASEKLAKVQSKVGDDSLRMNKNQFPKKKFRYEDLESRLSAMVDKGLLTQEEADEKLLDYSGK